MRALGYDERFFRIWRFYLSYCEAAFRVRHLRDMQLVLSRALNEALPRFPRDAPVVRRPWSQTKAYETVTLTPGRCGRSRGRVTARTT